MTLSNINTRRVAEGKRAFTLIELIVVIVIIGILAAVAAVSYNSFIAGANNSAAEATAAQVSKTLQADSALNQAAYSTYVSAGTPPAAAAPATTGWQGDAPDDVASILIAPSSTSGQMTLTVELGDGAIGAAGNTNCTVDFVATGVGTSPVTDVACS